MLIIYDLYMSIRSNKNLFHCKMDRFTHTPRVALTT